MSRAKVSGSHKRLYRIYSNAKQRCYNPNNPRYNCYGGKGITICDEWLNDFKSFYIWSVSNGYTDELTLDRLDAEKGYSPQNCRWITKAENSKHVFENPERRKINVERYLKWYYSSKTLNS